MALLSKGAIAKTLFLSAMRAVTSVLAGSCWPARIRSTHFRVCSSWQPRLRAATCDVSMQMDRRAAAGLIVAAPAAAFASSGDSPKQAYFATSPMSAPFGEVYTNQGTRLWTELGETERGIFTRIAVKTKQQLDEVIAPSCSDSRCQK
jgi:hypothetical protein